MAIDPITLLQTVESSLHQPWIIELPSKSFDLAVSLDVKYNYLPRAHEDNGSVKILHAPTWLIYWVHYENNRQIIRNQLLTEVIDDLAIW